MDVQNHYADEEDRLRTGGSPPTGIEHEIRRAVEVVLQSFHVSRAFVDIAIVSDDRIHEVNRQHLDHDWETDVITFAYTSKDDVSGLQGELLVSWETAAREAQRTGWPVATELLLYCIHGALHLVGLDDRSETERSHMRAAEKRILEILQPTGYERYDVDRRPQVTKRTHSQSCDRGGSPVSESVLWIVAGCGFVAGAIGGLGTELLYNFAGRSLEAYCRLKQDRDRYGSVLDLHDEAARGSEYLRIIGNVVFLAFGTAALAIHFQDEFAGAKLIVWTVATAATVMLTHLWLPSSVTRFASSPVLYHSWPFWRILSAVTAPLAAPGTLLGRLTRRLTGANVEEDEEDILHDEIRKKVAAGISRWLSRQRRPRDDPGRPRPA